MRAAANDTAFREVRRCAASIAALSYEGKYLSAVSPTTLGSRIDALWIALAATDLRASDALGVVYETLGAFLNHVPCAPPSPPIDAFQEMKVFLEADFREREPWIAIWQARKWMVSVFKKKEWLIKGLNGATATVWSLFANLPPKVDRGKEFLKAIIDAGHYSLLEEMCLAPQNPDALDFTITALWDTTLIIYPDLPLPGLRRWSETAAVELLRRALKNESLTMECVKLRRYRLGLRIDQPVLISAAGFREYGLRQIESDGAALTAYEEFSTFGQR